MRNGIKAGLAAFACAAPLALPAEAMTIFVSNEKGNSISVVNGETLEVTDTVEVGNRPRGIALSPNHRFLYICASSSEARRVGKEWGSTYRSRWSPIH